MVKDLKFCIIGFGIFGEKRLIPGFKGSKGTICAISKRNIDEAKKKAAEYNIPLYFDDPEVMLRDADVEAAYIASPNKNHLEHTILAAEHGMNIICEKPMATSIDDAIEMAKICKRRGVRFMIAHCYRFLGSCLKIKEIMETGMLGDVQFIHAHYSFPADSSPRKWVFDKKIAGGGPIFDIGVHMIDLIRFLLQGQNLIEFKGYSQPYDITKTPGRDVEASGSVLMRFSSGVQASVNCSFNAPFLTSIEVHGTKKSLYSRYFTIVEKDANMFIYSDNNFKNPEQSITVNNGNFYTRMIDRFINGIESNDFGGDFPGAADGLMNQIVLNGWHEGLSWDAIRSIMERI